MPEFFADTCALLARYKGSARLRPYFAEHDLVTTSLNVVDTRRPRSRGVAFLAGEATFRDVPHVEFVKE